MSVDKAGVSMPAGERETQLAASLSGKSGWLLMPLLDSSPGLAAKQSKNGTRSKPTGRRLANGSAAPAGDCTQAGSVSKSATHMPGGTALGSQNSVALFQARNFAPPAGDEGSPDVPAVVEDVDRLLELDRVGAELDHLAGSAAAAFAFRGRHIALPGVNGLVCGPIPLDAELRRLVIKPADIAENIDRSTADAVEREPAMAVINTVVINPPI